MLPLLAELRKGEFRAPDAGERRMPASAWRRLRLVVLRRDGWTCQRCGRHAFLEAHHRDGNPANNDPGNLVTFCRKCHIEAHRPPVAPDVAAWRELLRDM